MSVERQAIPSNTGRETVAENIEAIDAKIRALEDTMGPLLNLELPAGATISFGDQPGMAVLYSVCVRRLVLEVQRQGELTRAALKK